MVEYGRILAFSLDLIPFLPTSILPPREEAGGVVLGVDENGREVYLDWRRLPNFHGIIVGSTGSGKSTLAKSLIMDLQEEGIGAVIIDPHGEYKHFVERMGGVVIDMQENAVNPLELYTQKPETRADNLALACSLILGLSGEEEAEIREVFLEVLEKDSEAFPENIFNELDPSTAFKLKTLFEGWKKPFVSISTILEELRPIVLVYKSRGSPMPLRKSRFLTWVLLELVADYMSSKGIRSKPDVIVVLDEAHRMLSLGGEENVLVRCYRETRKFGYGFWVLTQSPTDLPLILYELAGFIILLSGPERYVRSISTIVRLGPREIDWLLYNTRGIGVLVRQGDPRPRRIKLRVRGEALEK
ncbi:MAG: hypothetical protein DRJ47_00555 [Thermoprotei archaeon]|nr:MAG: hypothetical protein DRJ47_00555 [Thermoprotei archaeon]